MCFETVSVFRDRFCYARMSSKLLWLKPAWLLRKDDTYQSKHALGTLQRRLAWHLRCTKASKPLERHRED